MGSRIVSPFLDEELFAQPDSARPRPLLPPDVEAWTDEWSGFEANEADAPLDEDEDRVGSGRDELRRIGNTLNAPFRWICSIAVNGEATNAVGKTSVFGLAPLGTGLLISPRHVLTAAHVLNGVERDESGQIVGRHQAREVEVSPGRDAEQRPFGSVLAASFKLHPKWKPEDLDSSYDVAVITLAEPIGERMFSNLGGRALGWWGGPGSEKDSALPAMPPALAEGLLGSRGLSAGYPQDAGQQMWCGGAALDTVLVDEGVRLRRIKQVAAWLRSARRLAFPIAASKGQSGSPVWVREGERRYLVGVLTVMVSGQGGHAVIVNPELLGQIRGLIGRDPSPWASTWLQHEEPETEAPAGEAGPMPMQSFEEYDQLEDSEADASEVGAAEDEALSFEVADEVDEFEDEADEAEAFEDEAAFEHDGPPPTHEVVVGERIEIDLAQSAFAGQVERVRWTIPGRAVRGWQGELHQSTLSELGDAELTQQRIAFHWVDAGDGRSVQARLRTKAGRDEVFSVVFDVKAPRVELFEAKTGRTRIDDSVRPVQMQFGQPRIEPGVHWDWTVVLPARHGGHLKDMQTVVSDVSQVQRLRPGGSATRRLVWRHPKQPALHSQYDGVDRGEPGYSEGLADVEHGGGEKVEVKGVEDSPATGLPTLATRVDVDRQFTYTLMWKPAGAGAIWVPLARARWAWCVRALRRGSRWRLLPRRMKPAIETACTEFPSYSSAGSENEWQEAGDPR